MRKSRSLLLGTAALAVAVASALGGALPASAGTRTVKAGAVKAIPARVDPAMLTCPKGKSVGSATCYVVASTSSSELVVPVVKGVPQSKTIAANGSVGIACASASLCIAVGSSSTGSAGVISWIVNGKLAKTLTLAGASYLYDAACPSATTCIVVGTQSTTTSSKGVYAVVTESESSPTAKVALGTGVLQSIACTSSTACLAAGSTPGFKRGLVVPINGGKASPLKLASGTTELADISCGSKTECWATGYTSSAKTGVQTVFVPVKSDLPGKSLKAPPYGSSIACVSATTCVFASGTAQYKGKGVVDEIVNGKIASSATIAAFAYGTMSGITCPTATSCLATGATGFHNPGPHYYYTGAVVSLQI